MAQFVVAISRDRRNEVLPGPQWIDQVNLPDASAVSYTVPADVNLVRVTKSDPAEPAFVRWLGGSAAIPAATLTNGQGAEPIPEVGIEAQVEPGQVISFIIGNNPLAISIACFRTASLT